VTEPRRLVLLGHPVSHSLSPEIQNAALASANIPVRYEAVDVAPNELEGHLARLGAEEGGGNITIPHKMSATRYMGSLTSEAREVGAVNAFAPDGSGGLLGHNTDVAGFDALARSVDAIRKGLRVAVIGSGGGAAAVLSAIRKWPNARAQIFARDQTRSTSLAERFSDVASVSAASAGDHIAGDLVVNATPIGLTDESFPVALDKLQPDAIVLDLVYRPGATAWVRAAHERGHRAADGIVMLVEQAAAAFAWWFEIEPDKGAMWRAVEKNFADSGLTAIDDRRLSADRG
jgi:shikimate dehydrogenase